MRYRCCFLVVVCLLASCSSSSGSPEPVQAGSSLLAGPWEICTRTAVSLGVSLLEESPFAPPAELVTPMAPSAGGMVFSVDDGVRGSEPWVSSGAPGAGTRLLKEIIPGAVGSHPTWFTTVGSRVFFAADDPVAGRELFVTDGTVGGTRRVKDIWPGAVGSFPNELFAFNGLLYFAAGDPTHGRELWRSDGSAAGTFMVEDFEPGIEDSSPHRFTLGGDGSLYFLASYRGVITILLRSDGGPGADEVFRMSSDHGFQLPLVAVGSKLFFAVGVSHSGGAMLMVTDGGAPPVMLRQFGMVGEMAGVGGRLLFSAAMGMDSDDMELWRSDGTASGTVLVEDILPGPMGSNPDHFTVLGNQLFFAADDGVHGVEPWDSDSTAAKTRLFGDLEAGAGSSFPDVLTTVDNLFFFSAAIRNRGAEPWVSNGVRITTVSLTEIAPGPLDSFPRSFTRSGQNVFFTAQDNSGVRYVYALPIAPVGGCPP
ncbi:MULTISPECIES: ELWxxDGT repeat protein [Myxococcus]|uniref:ELWxxDGT repeat protein n=1 Tax=Myxococcus TaxID=32 RepID=UPI0013D5BFDD|nr:MULTISPECIES: ELWxxDGT repeat protein [Myxococcus]NVJ21860.1 hypothetical protein [Myxococcus sp. AM011]